MLIANKSGVSLRFKPDALYEVLDLDLLVEQERLALVTAYDQQKKSTNPKWGVGAAAVAEDGTMVAIYNDAVGPSTHAEQRVLSELYRALRGEKRMKILALAGARRGDPVVSRSEPYPVGTPFKQIDWVCMCGKCGEFVHDCTANVDDVVVLSFAVTGQVVRTSLRSMFTHLHTSFRVPIKFENGAVYPVPSTEANKQDKLLNGHFDRLAWDTFVETLPR